MMRGIAAVALFGMLAGGTGRTAGGQVAETQDKSPAVRIEALTAQPTALFVARDGGLRRVIDVKVDLSRPAADLVLHVEAGGQTSDVPVPQAATTRTAVQEVEVPDAPGPIECKVTATVAGQSRSTSVTVGPQRKWRVYLAASSHTDIGYTHLQPQCAEHLVGRLGTVRHEENQVPGPCPQPPVHRLPVLGRDELGEGRLPALRGHLDREKPLRPPTRCKLRQLIQVLP